MVIPEKGIWMQYNDKAIIFDLDGTLLDTLGDLHAAFNYAALKFGYPERTIAETKNSIGGGIKKALQRLLPNTVKEDELEAVIECFKEYYEKNMYVYTKPYDGIIEMLKSLKRKGYKTAIVSNKYDEAVKKLNNRFFEGCIDTAIGERNGIRRKPEADGIKKVLSELHVKKENTVYAGDSEIDIQTAKNANIPCISVLWGFKEKDFLLQNGAKFQACSPYDIIEITDKIFGLNKTKNNAK